MMLSNQAPQCGLLPAAFVGKKMMISIASVVLAIMTQAGAAPAPGRTLQYFVVSPTNDTHKYSCASGARLSDKTIIPGTVVLFLEETEFVLKVIEIESGQTVCLKVRKEDLVPIQPLRARDGTPAPFPGKLFGISMPLVFLSATLVDPELRMKGMPATAGAFTTAMRLPSARAEDDSDLLPSEQTLLVLLVNKDGHVSRCQIFRPSGDPNADHLAEQTVCRARYEGARQRGQPVAVTLVLRFASNRP
ncbi:MAG TPA: energy transducer TonB [Candidatus Acidoferrales bacterium]|nr:energy transducer TonB [Candidatus Acidoferrales bacterium]